MSTNGIPQPGQRIRLVYTNDQFTRLVPGSEGTVTRVRDDYETSVGVQWDDGSRLSLLPDEGDVWEVVGERPRPCPSCGACLVGRVLRHESWCKKPLTPTPRKV